VPDTAEILRISSVFPPSPRQTLHTPANMQISGKKPEKYSMKAGLPFQTPVFYAQNCATTRKCLFLSNFRQGSAKSFVTI
jgi:hypothetical protein